MQTASFYLPSVLLLPVDRKGNTGEILESLIGACLQASLEKHGSGLEGMKLTEELNQILAMVETL